MTCPVPGCAHPLPCPWHPAPATPPPMREDGRELRDRALAQVEANAKAEWNAKARAMLLSFAARGRPFTTDDFWDGGLEKPREPRAIGHIIMWGCREKLIKWTGSLVKCRYASRHHTDIKEWIGV